MSDAPIPQQTITMEDGGLPPASAYFLSLTIENIRCFAIRQTLDLSDGNGKPCMWNVLLGENGTGKTTLLVAIMANLPGSSSGIGNATEKELNYKELSDFLSVKNAEKMIGVVTIKGDDNKEFEFNVIRYIESNMSCAEYVNSKIFFFLEGGSMNRFSGDRKLLDNVAYFFYSGSRLLDQKSIASNDRSKLSVRSLLDPLIPLPNAEEWLVQSDYAAKLEPDNPKPKQRLEMVKKLLCEFLPDVEDFKFGIAPGTTMTPRVEAKTPYGWVRVRDLSLGYQTALAWIVDFASRMMDRYPESENPFAEPAICLVDEIDLHTHPKWQKELVHTLRQLFPKTQFIVTAHSPLIVQAAEDANIALLRREGDHVVIENDVDYIRNWRVDQILSSTSFSNVGGESALSERLMAERTVLVEKGAERTEADEVRLREIDAEMEKLPAGTTAEDREASAFIREAAAWLKETKQA